MSVSKDPIERLRQSIDEQERQAIDQQAKHNFATETKEAYRLSPEGILAQNMQRLLETTKEVKSAQQTFANKQLTPARYILGKFFASKKIAQAMYGTPPVRSVREYPYDPPALVGLNSREQPAEPLNGFVFSVTDQKIVAHDDTFRTDWKFRILEGTSSRFYQHFNGGDFIDVDVFRDARAERAGITTTTHVYHCRTSWGGDEIRGLVAFDEAGEPLDQAQMVANDSIAHVTGLIAAGQSYLQACAADVSRHYT